MSAMRDREGFRDGERGWGGGGGERDNLNGDINPHDGTRGGEESSGTRGEARMTRSLVLMFRHSCFAGENSEMDVVPTSERNEAAFRPQVNRIQIGFLFKSDFPVTVHTVFIKCLN